MTSSRAKSRAPKGKSNTEHSTTAQPPVASGTGTATDPVIVSDESANPVSGQSTPSAPPAAVRRVTRSQQARSLLDALPDDPSDILTQTLRTILKTPTTAPYGRTGPPRNTAVYLANGRLTGTPFLRLLRYLAGPTRRTDPALGLALLKKLVEAMRATEEMMAKTTPAGQSSAASTPMPATPGTPSAASFPTCDSLGVPSLSKEPTEPNLFSQFNSPSASGFDSFTLPAIAEIDTLEDIPIDPELLALAHDPTYLQAGPQGFRDFDFDFGELLDAFPGPVLDWSASPATSSSTGPASIDSGVVWDEFANLPLDDLLKGWVPPGNPHLVGSHPPSPAAVDTQAEQQHPQLPEQPPSQPVHTPTSRPPTRSEAQVVLERAKARKRELEEKIAAAKRQLWGCRIEAGVERNLLDMLVKK